MDSLTALELDDVYAFAIELGKSAGKILLEAAQQRYGDNAVRDEQHIEKLNAVDLVTKTDEGTLVQFECHHNVEAGIIWLSIATISELSKPHYSSSFRASRNFRAFPLQMFLYKSKLFLCLHLDA